MERSRKGRIRKRCPKNCGRKSPTNFGAGCSPATANAHRESLPPCWADFRSGKLRAPVLRITTFRYPPPTRERGYRYHRSKRILDTSHFLKIYPECGHQLKKSRTRFSHQIPTNIAAIALRADRMTWPGARLTPASPRYPVPRADSTAAPAARASAGFRRSGYLGRHPPDTHWRPRPRRESSWEERHKQFVRRNHPRIRVIHSPRPAITPPRGALLLRRSCRGEELVLPRGSTTTQFARTRNRQ